MAKKYEVTNFNGAIIICEILKDDGVWVRIESEDESIFKNMVNMVAGRGGKKRPIVAGYSLVNSLSFKYDFVVIQDTPTVAYCDFNDLERTEEENMAVAEKFCSEFVAKI